MSNIKNKYWTTVYLQRPNWKTIRCFWKSKMEFRNFILRISITRWRNKPMWITTTTGSSAKQMLAAFKSRFAPRLKLPRSKTGRRRRMCWRRRSTLYKLRWNTKAKRIALTNKRKGNYKNNTKRICKNKRPSIFMADIMKTPPTDNSWPAAPIKAADSETVRTVP